jgi:hypothetical protein
LARQLPAPFAARSIERSQIAASAIPTQKIGSQQFAEYEGPENRAARLLGRMQNRYPFQKPQSRAKSDSRNRTHKLQRLKNCYSRTSIANPRIGSLFPDSASKRRFGEFLPDSRIVKAARRSAEDLHSG